MFQDEVLVASDRIVLKLEDLVTWITEEVEWNHGILAPVSKPVKGQDASPPVVKEEKKEGQEETDPKEGEEKEEKKNDLPNEKEETKSVEIKEEPSQGELRLVLIICTQT